MVELLIHEVTPRVSAITVIMELVYRGYKVETKKNYTFHRTLTLGACDPQIFLLTSINMNSGSYIFI